MAQQTSSTPQVTSTNGVIHTNQPINPQTIVRAEKVEVRINDGRDKNLYPAILMEIEDEGKQFWYYVLGDEATRDSDYDLLDAAICPPTAPRIYDAIISTVGDEGDYTSIEDAINAGACTLFIKDGVYNEVASSVLGDNCALYGESSGVVITYPSGLGLIVDGGGVDNSAGTISVNKGSNIVTGLGTSFALSDVGRTINIGTDFFTISAYTSLTQITIDKKWNGDSTTGLSYTIRDYTKGVILDTINIIGGGGASSPISLTNSLNCTIKNVYVEGGGQENLLISNSGRIAVDNLISKGATLNGVKVLDGVGVKISKSNASNCLNSGFLVDGGKGNSISQCFASNNLNGFEVINNGDDIVIDNVNSNLNDEDGVEVNGVGNVVVSNSTITANGVNGVSSVNSRCSIIGNTITGKGKTVGGTIGVFVDTGAARIIGNYVEEYGTGISLAAPTPGSTVSSNEVRSCNLGFNCSDNNATYTGNIVSDYDLRGFLVGGDNNTFIGNRVYDSTGTNDNGFELNGTDNLLVSNISYNNFKGYRINANGNKLLSNTGYNNTTSLYSINPAVTSLDFDVREEIDKIPFNKPAQLQNIDTTTRNGLTPSNGWLIYNTDTNKAQVYAGGVWVDLH